MFHGKGPVGGDRQVDRKRVGEVQFLFHHIGHQFPTHERMGIIPRKFPGQGSVGIVRYASGALIHRALLLLLLLRLLLLLLTETTMMMLRDAYDLEWKHKEP